MLDSLRAEFPAVARIGARLRRPSVSGEGVAWAFVSGTGAGFLAHAVTVLVVSPVFAALLPPTVAHPSWLTVAVVANVVSAFVAGGVLMRAGGPGAVGLYVGYQVLALLTGVPARAAACAQLGPAFAPGGGPCDYAAMLTARWPWALALAAGAGASALLWPGARAGANRLLRGAGAYSLVIGVFFAFADLVLRSAPPAIPWTVIVVLVYGAAGIAAGALLTRAPFPASVLVALLGVAPSFAVNIGLVRSQAQAGEPVELSIARWGAVFAPLLGAIALVVAREYVLASRSPGAVEPASSSSPAAPDTRS